MRLRQFQSQEEVDADAFSEDILRTIRELSNKNMKVQSSPPFVAIQPVFNNTFQKAQKQFQELKPRKMIKLNSGLQAAPACKKITDFFTKPIHTALPKLNPLGQDSIVRELREKIAAKHDKISQLQKQLENIKQRNARVQNEYNDQARIQREQIKKILIQSYELRINHQHMEARTHNSLQKDQLLKIEKQIAFLKESKKKKKTKGDDDNQDKKPSLESDKKMFTTEADRRLYTAAIVSRLQKQKQHLSAWNQSITLYEIPSQIRTKLNGCALFKDYIFLCLLSIQPPQIILAMDLSTLSYQSLTVYKLPQFSSVESRTILYNQCTESLKQSKKLSATNSLFQANKVQNSFLRSTVVGFLTQKQQQIVIGHEYFEDMESLQQFMSKCEYGTTEHSNIVRYICKVVISALHEYKIKTGIQTAILPQNVFLTPQCTVLTIVDEVRIAGLSYNNVLMSNILRHVLFRTEAVSYYAPQAIREEYKGSAVWSVGVLCYELMFRKRPFECTTHQNKRETMTQIWMPVKVNEKCKQFIKGCFVVNQDRPICQLLSHPYFIFK